MFSRWEKFWFFSAIVILLGLLIISDYYKAGETVVSKVECNRLCQPNEGCDIYSACSNDCKNEWLEFICKDGTTYYKLGTK